MGKLDATISHLSSTGFLTWDVCLNILVGDETFASIYGLDAREVSTGVTIETILARISLVDRERMARETHDAILNGRPCKSRFSVMTAQGPRAVTFIGRCLQNPEGIPTYFTGSIAYELNDELEIDASSAEEHCRTALGLAKMQRNEIAYRHLRSALEAFGRGQELHH